MITMLRRVFVIQEKDTGKFLTSGLNYTYNLNRAGRIADVSEAVETAVLNIGPGNFEVYGFYEEEQN